MVSKTCPWHDLPALKGANQRECTIVAIRIRRRSQLWDHYYLALAFSLHASINRDCNGI
jgi:hypothetical protein